MSDDEKLPLQQFRSDLPLTDADFAAIRAGVMGTIARSRSPFAGRRWQLAFAAIAIVVACVAAFVTMRRPAAVRPAAPVVRHDRAIPQTFAAAEPPDHPVDVAPPVAAEQPRSHPHPRPAPHHGSHRAARPPEHIAAASPRVSIQLQTSDPDIRIIWIAR